MKIYFLTVSIFALTGCGSVIEVTPLKAPIERQQAGIPVEVMTEAERDIRAVVGQIHRSRTDKMLTQGTHLTNYRIEAQLLQSQDNLRDKYTGEYYYCSDIAIRLFFNLTNSYYETAGKWVHTKNMDGHARTDQVCTYQTSGKEHYYPGPTTRITEQKE